MVPPSGKEAFLEGASCAPLRSVVKPPKDNTMAGQKLKPGTAYIPPSRQPGDIAAEAVDAVPDTGGDVDEVSEPSAGRELLRRAYDFLAEQGVPLDTATLASHIFGSGSAATGAGMPWARLADDLLRASSLFAVDDQGLWGLVSWAGAERPLEDVEFAVVDVETTGLAPGRHRVIEVAATILKNGEVVASYSRLVNPARSIPQFISKFTGITPSMVARAASAEKVLPRFLEFIGHRPIVGHNIGFDLNFLNYESDRLSLPSSFDVSGIDTITLARRYLTGLRRMRLDAVAAALHVPTPTRHRALADAQITARVFALLLTRARDEGCLTLADLYRVLDGVAPERAAIGAEANSSRPTGRMYLNPAWRRQFPAAPGVYLMKDEAGTVIYVGKAKCLRDRLASYYSQPLGYTRKMDGLLQTVREIETRTLGSELEALLVESRLIKELQPRYNVQLRNFEQYPFIKVDLQHPYPRFYASREVAADGARYFGPFRSGRIVDATIDLIQKVFPLRTCTRNLPPDAAPSEPCLRYHLKRCPAPCRGELDTTARQEYERVVEEVSAFLGGERQDLLDKLKQQMYAASAAQDFERAARLRDALRDADQVLLGQRLVAGAVLANNLLIAYPSAEPDAVELFLVRHGRLADQRRADREATQLEEQLRAIITDAARLGVPPARVGREEVDQINIIARWIHHHSDDEERSFFPLPQHLDERADTDDFVRHVVETILAQTTADEADEAEQAKETREDQE
jgi:DNA polymerase-3 subunit epsilon